MRICQNIFRQNNNTTRLCENMSGGFQAFKNSIKYVLKLDCLGGAFVPPPSKIWNDVPAANMDQHVSEHGYMDMDRDVLELGSMRVYRTHGYMDMDRNVFIIYFCIKLWCFLPEIFEFPWWSLNFWSYSKTSKRRRTCFANVKCNRTKKNKHVSNDYKHFLGGFWLKKY